MLQSFFSLCDKAKTAYLSARENNPTVLTGDFNILLRLHRKEEPDQAIKSSADGTFSIALIDICAVAAICTAFSALAGLFALCGHIVRKLF